MKGTLVLSFMFCVSTVSAQDTLQFHSGKQIPCRIMASNDFAVWYYPRTASGVLSGKKRSTSKALISSIHWRDSSKTYSFHRKSNPMDTSSFALNDSSTVRLAKSDANIYYKNYSGASTGTLIATFPGSPVLGAIVGLVTSTTPPKTSSLGIPNSEFSSDFLYRKSYARQAKRIKSRHVWTSWGAGVAVNLVFYFFVLSTKVP